MRALTLMIANRGGYILMGSVVVGVAVIGLAIAGSFMSSQSLVANRNQVERAKAFYASDGVVTMMVQDMIDGNPQKYLLCRWLDSSAVIGNATAGCTYQHPAPARDSINGNGGGIGATTADAGFYFRYIKLWGDIEMKARIVSMGNPAANAKAALMIRGTCAANSKYAMVGLTNGSTQAAFQYRSTTGGTAVVTTAGAIAPWWVKLVRKGSAFRGYRSTDGVIWTQVGSEQTIAMGDTVRVGLAVTSASGSTLCMARVDSLNLGHGRGADTIGDVIVTYTMDKSADGGYDLVATGTRYDAMGRAVFSMPLRQHFAPAIGTQVVVPNDGWLHYVLYDFRSDGSNPVFRSCPPHERTGGVDVLGVDNSHTPFLVDSFLTADRKPISKQDYSVDPVSRVQRWANLCGTSKMMWWRHDDGTAASVEKACCAIRMEQWFRPSGSAGPDMTLRFEQVDPKQPSMWRWLKPDGSLLDSTDGDVDDAVYGPNYVKTYDMANCIVYDKMHFVKQNVPFASTGGGTVSGGEVWGYVRQWTGDQAWVPLDRDGTGLAAKRGFKSERGTDVVHSDDPYVGEWTCNAPGVKDKLTHLNNSTTNHCWTMEIHTQLLYRKGKDTYFAYQDASGTDVWVYVNNRLAYDLGDPHWVPPDPDQEQVLLLDSLANLLQLEEGNYYPIDIFITSRWEGGISELQMVTDFEMFTPKVSRSAWRRDYGRLD